MFKGLNYMRPRLLAFIKFIKFKKRLDTILCQIVRISWYC